jgi:hypothetical protein
VAVDKAEFCAQIGRKVLQETHISVGTVTSCPSILGDKTLLKANFTYAGSLNKYAT